MFIYLNFIYFLVFCVITSLFLYLLLLFSVVKQIVVHLTLRIPITQEKLLIKELPKVGNVYIRVFAVKT